MPNAAASSRRNDATPRSARRSGPLRSALIGAAGVAVLIGGGAGLSLVPAFAESSPPVTEGMHFTGPASFADMVDRVKGAVVAVKVTTIDKGSDNQQFSRRMPRGVPQLSPDDPLYRFFKRFGAPGGAPLPRRPHKGLALGSGFFISSDGYVVTNNHVVENEAKVTLTLDSGKTVPAKVVGVDKKTDLALLKATEGGPFPYVKFSDVIPRVGDWVIAVGNPFGLGGTVTAGIVSARGRDIGTGPYDDFLQIDAPVNRGNSGGPTFNAKGEVVGVNTAIYSPSGGSVGIGFDIPSEIAKSVIAELKEKGKVTRGYIGVRIQPVTQDIADSLGLKSTDGALVAQTQPNTPAAAAGIESGDVITGVNGEKVHGPRELSRTIAEMGPNADAKITYIRNGVEKSVTIKLGVLPNEIVANAKPEPAKAAKTALANFGLVLSPASQTPGAGKQGAVVTQIDSEGVAAQKGLRLGDVILEAGGKPVNTPEDVVKALSVAKKSGRHAVLLRVKSGENMHFLALSTDAS